MDEKYFPKKVEQKWQKKWAETKAFATNIDDARPKFYQLGCSAATTIALAP